VTRARFVLDNSVVLAWCFDDEQSAYADATLELLEHGEAMAPAIWPLEVGNALLVAQRRKRIARADAAHFLQMVRQLPITVEQTTPAQIFTEVYSLARDLQLSTYDAAYLDLAIRSNVPIATLDKPLLKGAKQYGIAVLDPLKPGN
jgi:predicted nucleic acid-binding protein